MVYQIQFFQATATAIPTLLIAVALAGRGGDRMAIRIPALKGFRLFFECVVAMFVIAVIVGGELASLIVLLRGQSQFAQAALALMAVTFCLMFLVRSLLDPIMQKMDKVNANRLDWAYVAVVVVVTVAGTSALN